MAVILASGVTEAASSDVVVTVPVTVFLTDPAGPVVDPSSLADVQIKSNGGEYFTIGTLKLDNGFAQSITSPGTYRVLRRACAVAFAVEQT